MMTICPPSFQVLIMNDLPKLLGQRVLRDGEAKFSNH